MANLFKDPVVTASTLSPLAFLESLKRDHTLAERLIRVRETPAKDGSYLEPAQPLHTLLRSRLEQSGIRKLYRHQALALDAVREGRHVAVVTPTASGKTLTYLLPVLSRLIEEPEARALFLFPIKALAQDQLGVLQEWLDFTKAGTAAIYDGDTNAYRRGKMKLKPPNIILTNPDMLHLGILPFHSGWASFFSKLRYIVVDEAHTYRGIFGSHVSMIFKRLRRIARAYGTDPQFIFLSATIANPAEFTSRLLGSETRVIAENGAPSGARHFALWNPQASPYSESTDLFSRLVRAGFKTIAFTKARKITELMALWTKQGWPELKDRIRSYRAGYLPEERREIEKLLFSGQLDGVLTTSALELGIDVGGLDACLLVGYPGTMISTLQRSGRVGREGQASLVIMVALSDAMDQYFMNHPDFFFSKPTEHALVPVDNKVITRKHLQAAAEEMPLSESEKDLFGEHYPAKLDELWKLGALRKSNEGRYHSSLRQAARQIQIRSSGDSFAIEAFQKGSAPRLIGRMDVPRVYRDCHPGAIYIHAGAQYRVATLDQSLKRVQVEELETDYYTEARGRDEIEILQVLKRSDYGHVSWCFGEVQAHEQVTGYVTKQISTQKILAEYELELPVHTYQTQAAWWILPREWREEFARMGLDFAGAIHALEHAQIAMLPMFVLCDRWDLGGVSMWVQPQLDQPAIFIYDGYPGGAALAEKGFEIVGEWLAAVKELLSGCTCEDGCPACIQSPKCGNGNKPLDKKGCTELLRRLMAIRESGQAAGEGKAPVNPPAEPTAPAPPKLEFLPSAAPLVAKPDPDALNIVFFDLETQFLAAEVGGWDRKDAMKVSVAVTYSTRARQFRQYSESGVKQLVDELAAADLVVGFNSKGFDYAVLQPYTDRPLQNLPSLDMLEVIHKTLGYRLSLQSLGSATLNAAKSGDGIQAVTWFREGKLGLLLEYCQQDVALTRDLWEFGRKYGYLMYNDKNAGLMKVSVNW